ncbi:enoyl-CoA hydratase/isomerase family protein [Catenulispora rubra]|uniref:enoyl-CoA hydratase/isomerase family protein n=1 Tax=Catenulispora rubra TaxID=280293 RepID=UPI001892181F|nr:enoyl-CoA hydratase/isomerase family protein [Catenulispora rubra]
MEQTLSVERVDTVEIVTMNRPEVLNAIDATMVAELSEHLDRCAADDDIRVVVLMGAGRAFSSGYDLRTLDDDATRLGPTKMFEYARYVHDFAEKIWRFRKPLIAATHGYCLGGAAEIAMLCDLTITTESCVFGEPEVRFSSASPSLILPWLVPLKIAKELLLTGATITAQRALEIGMVNEVVPDGDLRAAALRKAQVVATVSPLCAQMHKKGINDMYETMGLLSSMRHHNVLAAMVDGTATEEFRKFTEISERDGLKAALKWRDDQFKDLENN